MSEREPVADNVPVKIELQVGEWNQVLSLLAEHPFRIVAPLIGKMRAQAQAGLNAAQQPAAALANGPLPKSEAGHVPN
jgi:hypothetical protein